MITCSMYENQNYPTNKDKTILIEANNKQSDTDKKTGKCCKKG